MLEEKIETLIQSIDVLNVQLQRLFEAKDEIKEPAPKPKAKAKKAEKTEGPKPTRNDKEIQDICLKIVRDDKANGTKKAAAIKPLIKKFGGALVKDVPTEKLAELKAALEEL